VNFVTKILVVFATILSVFLSALVISFAVNADRIKEDYSAEVASKIAAQDSLKAAAFAGATELTDLKRKVDDKEREASGERTRNAEMEKQMTSLLLTNRSLQDTSDRSSALAIQLTNTNDVQTKLISALRKDADDSRTRQAETAKRNAELEKAIADLRRTFEAAENEKKLVREQLAEARSQLEALKQSGATLGTGGSNEPFVYSGPVISGKVEEVSTDAATGARLARISVGTNDNIRENMKLAIQRDTEFVGNLVILKTDLKWAIGKVDLLGRTNIDVQIGDVVRSDLK
jgi:hypothetical protein